MSRRDEARRYLESWEPDAVELPDWVVDALEADEGLQALFDARFVPWDGRQLGLAPAAPAPAPAPARRRPARVWLGPIGAVGLLAATALVAVLVGQPGADLARERVADLPIARPEPARVPEAEELPPAAEAVAADPVTGEPSTSIPETRRETATVPAPTRPATARPAPATRRAPIVSRDRSAMRLAPVQKVVLTQSRLQILEKVVFPPRSATVPEEASPLLDAVAQVLGEHPEIGAVLLEGHADAVGTAAEKLLRSQQRAEAVRAALIARGVAPERLTTEGRGDLMPIAARTDSSSKAWNERVEFRIVERDPPVPAPPPPPVPEPPATETYTDWGHHAFQDPDRDPLSTFSIDVDTASYSIVRRKLREGYLPPPAAVRVEEFVNAMTYTYPAPPEGAPFGVSFEAAPNPFDPRTHLVRVGVQGRRVPVDQRRSVHLTFLVDTSGSMQSADKLALAQEALRALTGELRDGDTVAVATYAGSAGVVLPPTPMSERQRVLEALEGLQAGGSTAMGQGIEVAYRLADQTFREDAINRVVIVSDGDANVGVTDPAALTELVRGYARKGITLTVAGFGMGNYQDTRMEALANDGDGNYWYIDSPDEAREVFVDRLQSTLVVIGKDVKLQVAWDPAQVEAYRLIGYENRDLADADFRNDGVDAGEIGSGHQVTALYEVALAEGASGRLATVHVRNKAPGPDSPAVERRFELTTAAVRPDLGETSRNFRLAVASASFAELLRQSPHLHGAGFREVAAIARSAAHPEYPEDQELVDLILRAADLSD